MLRIAMLSYHTCPLATLGGKDTGGMNVYVRDLTRALGALGVHVDVFTRFVFVGNWASQTISVFAVNPADGTLVLAGNYPTESPNGLAVDPTGRFLYVACTNTLRAYAIDGTTGALTPMAGMVIQTGWGARPGGGGGAGAMARGAVAGPPILLSL